jgi:hypothetical protein
VAQDFTAILSAAVSCAAGVHVSALHQEQQTVAVKFAMIAENQIV